MEVRLGGASDCVRKADWRIVRLRSKFRLWKIGRLRSESQSKK